MISKSGNRLSDKTMLEQNSLQGVGGSPEDLKAFIDGERAKWRPVIEAAKITM